MLSGLDSTSSLLVLVRRLVDAILQARGEVRNAPEKTSKLLEKVVKVQSSLQRLKRGPGGQLLWNGPEDNLKDLGAVLCLAWEKLQSNVKSNERREAGNLLVATARSLIGRGASQQNRETAAIIQRLDEVLETLDRDVLYFIGGVVAELRALSIPRASPPQLPHDEHELVTRMLTLASESDEILSLKVEVSIGNAWTDPLHSKKQVGRKPVDRPVGRKRDAREGGYEVSNCTKVRFCMSITYNKWYFYVLTSDRWANAEPRVVFPKSAKCVTNLVPSESKRPVRVFPNKELHREDPVSLKVERSANLPDDEEGQVSIFIVLTTTPLQKDDAHGQRITIQDIERHMDSAGGKLIVKHIPIDVLK